MGKRGGTQRRDWLSVTLNPGRDEGRDCQRSSSMSEVRGSEVNVNQGVNVPVSMQIGS